MRYVKVLTCWKIILQKQGLVVKCWTLTSACIRPMIFVQVSFVFHPELEEVTKIELSVLTKFLKKKVKHFLLGLIY